MDLFASDDAEATIYATGDEDEVVQAIVAVDHELLKQRTDPSISTTEEGYSMTLPETFLPLVVASPIPEEDEELAQSRASTRQSFGMDSSHVSSASASHHESNLFSSQGCKSPVMSKARIQSQLFGMNHSPMTKRMKY
jgi:hypothetical protein